MGLTAATKYRPGASTAGLHSPVAHGARVQTLLCLGGCSPPCPSSCLRTPSHSWLRRVTQPRGGLPFAFRSHPCCGDASLLGWTPSPAHYLTDHMDSGPVSWWVLLSRVGCWDFRGFIFLPFFLCVCEHNSSHQSGKAETSSETHGPQLVKLHRRVSLTSWLKTQLGRSRLASQDLAWHDCGDKAASQSMGGQSHVLESHAWPWRVFLENEAVPPVEGGF